MSVTIGLQSRCGTISPGPNAWDDVARELYEAFHEGMGKARHPWLGLTRRTKDRWVRVARKAQSMAVVLE